MAGHVPVTLDGEIIEDRPPPPMVAAPSHATSDPLHFAEGKQGEGEGEPS